MRWSALPGRGLPWPTTWLAAAGRPLPTPPTATSAPAWRPYLDALPERPLHGDWQTNNLFFAGDEVSGIIDFHQADFGPRVLDLAIAVERNCFFWNRISACDDTAFDLRQAELLVRSYDAETPLGPVERTALADVIAVCQLEYGISFLDYYWGVERDREKADWAWHTFVLGHARGRGSPEGREAAAAIRGWWTPRP